jgi:excinuclease ABC subunit B
VLGITGSGKTFSIANVISEVRPALVLEQDAGRAAGPSWKELFPHNSVEYFVSYYDYYQPEAYVPSSDTFIEKDASINDAIDRMRHAATHALLSRPDVIIVASVSCIYGIGSAESYSGLLIQLEQGVELRRDELLRRLVDIQDQRNDVDFHRGTFRVRGDVVEIFPCRKKIAPSAWRWGDGTRKDPLARCTAGGGLRHFPGSHYVRPRRSGTGDGVHQGRAEVRPRAGAENSSGGSASSRGDVRPELLEQTGFATASSFSPLLAATQARRPGGRLLRADFIVLDVASTVLSFHDVPRRSRAEGKCLGVPCPPRWTTDRSSSTSSRN